MPASFPWGEWLSDLKLKGLGKISLKTILEEKVVSDFFVLFCLFYFFIVFFPKEEIWVLKQIYRIKNTLSK